VTLSPSESRFVSRAMIGFWFAGLSILGYVRFFMRAFRENTFSPDLSAWLWLGGAIALSLAGVYIIIREARRKPSARH
jgi:hypothetical protein